jgi:hypothetical protein
MRQRSRGKDTKSLGIKTLLSEKTSKKLQVSEKVLIFAFINANLKDEQWKSS